MKAIEFIATKKQGDTIEIPKKYINEISGEFRVILLLAVPEKKALPKREFTALKIKTKGFIFNRNDVYEL